PRIRARKGATVRINASMACAGIGTLVLGAESLLASAQPIAFGGGYGPPLELAEPAREFASSEEHYADLLEQANVGTTHTLESVPRWDGLWVTAGNTHMDAFITTGSFDGEVREGVLTPAYEEAYKERWRQQIEDGQVH